MEFSKFELSLLLILVEGKIEDLNFVIHDLEFNKSFIDKLEYEKLKVSHGNSLKSTQLLRNKIKKLLEE